MTLLLLLEIALRSSLVLAVGLALMPLLKRQSAALRHWVLFISLLCSAAVPVATELMPAWPSVDVSPLVPAPIAARVSPASSQIGGPSGSAAAAGADVQRLTDGSMLATFAVPIWLAGVLLSTSLLLVGVLRLYRLDATATPVSDGPWSRAVHPGAAVRVTRRPGLLLVWGVLRPTIIVPESALLWPPDRVGAVAAHELAHVRRRDWIIQIVAEMIRAVYWFNPLVWIACGRLRAECEMACDDTVIVKGASGSQYASHVVAIARELTTQYWLPAPAIIRSSTLERRIRAMLDKTRNRRPPAAGARATAFALLIASSAAIAAVAAQSFVSLSGTIVDPSNGVLPGVKLILTNEQTQAKYEIKTDSSGRYEFVGLPPGSYVMDAALPGFSRFSGRVTVAGQSLQQDLTLSVGNIQETITVTQDPAPGPPPAPDPDRERKIAEFKARRAAAKCPDVHPGGAVRTGGNIRVPVKLRDFKPHYPESMRGSDGLVVLSATIGTNGAVQDVDVVSTTHPEFSQSAIDAVRQWEFDATLLNCEPILTPMTVTVNFRVK